MATNIVYDPATHMELILTDPASPISGDACRFGAVTGLALIDEKTDGKTTVHIGTFVADLSVKAINDSGNSAVALGDHLFYVDADTPKISKKSSGYFYGFALETINAGSTDTIRVLHVPSPGSGALAAGSVGAAQLADNFLVGTQAGNVANANVIGGLPVVHRIDIADAASGDVDVVLTHKTRVIDVCVVKTGANGGAANTIQVKNGANAITDAISININDTLIARAASIDDAQHEIAAAGTLRVTRTKAGGNAACIVYVWGIRVA